MKEDFLNTLSSRFNKKAFHSKMRNLEGGFELCAQIAMEDHDPASWRAAWVLEHVMKKNDPRLLPLVNDFLSVLPEKEDGHQRCILRVIRQMKLNDEQESLLFDSCLNIWEAVGKIPSLRITALEIALKISKKYPELKGELGFLFEQQYTETLSPGIAKTLVRLKKENGF